MQAPAASGVGTSPPQRALPGTSGEAARRQTSRLQAPLPRVRAGRGSRPAGWTHSTRPGWLGWRHWRVDGTCTRPRARGEADGAWAVCLVAFFCCSPPPGLPRWPPATSPPPASSSPQAAHVHGRQSGALAPPTTRPARSLGSLMRHGHMPLLPNHSSTCAWLRSRRMETAVPTTGRRGRPLLLLAGASRNARTCGAGRKALSTPGRAGSFGSPCHGRDDTHGLARKIVTPRCEPPGAGVRCGLVTCAAASGARGGGAQAALRRAPLQSG